uniref:hypothetical protein n=1 Tax=Nocardia abscessus TaxID=120957 RepID=UPI0024541A43
NLRWRRNTRLIIDGLVAHGGVLSANLPSGMPVKMRFDDLPDPGGFRAAGGFLSPPARVRAAAGPAGRYGVDHG